MTMTNKKFVGAFHSIDTVLYKIVELKAQGYSENDLHLFSHEQDNISMLRDQSDVNLHGSYGKDWHVALAKLLEVNGQARNAFIELGFSDEEAKHYYDELDNGGVGIFVDGAAENQLVEADSSVELGESGELLDSQDNMGQVTTPRINTDSL